ncbi:NAD-dependent epimerase/dehydratase family protein [Paenibacillus nasutitermitis]|uniref:Nucleoside-diphosphate-sugar epimerase n=1 Tax=Paenibacillus nasutitermitis TaxID=1652958 RepID=A0A917DMF1_9BACL|nr:NAD(P)-dependent oxidoreductase [Paenibacillus nasutitermitis]GGD52516.1 nucleoside-diphosphate-sugar epimerase [Paenibacillus nasutitermitis]
MKHIAVTGGSGKLGRQVVSDLTEHGYKVTVVDNKPPDGLPCTFINAHLLDAGEAYGALKGTDAVIHLAAIPGLTTYTHGRIFTNNVISTYNVLEAAEALGMKRAVIGSSESSYGFFWAKHPFVPDYLPVDENHPKLPQETYGMSKVINEMTAGMFNRSSGMHIAPLRFSTIISEREWPHIVRQLLADPARFKRNLYSHVDVRDASAACRLALEMDIPGAQPMNITSGTTLSDVDTPELIARYFPGITDIREDLSGHRALVSNSLAREVLGWQPVHSWREFV